ncbi:hypothetical protein ILUMI_24178 [Ignelater luminosus]|uniref:Peptidase S1 domain-containing protein n=1 Tax=Ignelater luminosus TaxID=2038154 RepID=A0A8K0FYZ9_IGNLU|nr:hypothetical protein ILUMI_24178 [Ignelater luminosus]
MRREIVIGEVRGIWPRTEEHGGGSTSVRLGEHNVKTDEDCEGDTPGLEYCSDPPVDVEVEKVIGHERYVPDDRNSYGDIALIRLKEEVEYTAGSQICAGGKKGENVCKGDSGSSLMYRDRMADTENWVTVGVVSFGLHRCALENVPAVFTRVTEYIQWILDNIEP